jgi:peptidoglycan/LPS O-acetylase OafA/YrhL
VFVFHLDNRWLPGGFVGVDVFFVISGYLIASILLREYEHGSFSLWNFYQRRVARLFPAYFTVAITTFTAVMLIYSYFDMAKTASGFIAATLSSANMIFMLGNNYFALSSDSKPFLHCWSLSVEEQFYLLFPGGLLLLYVKARRYMMPTLIGITAASFLGCVVLTRMKPEYAFFLLPTRAWELLVGSILAVGRSSFSPDLEKWMSHLSWVGLALIALSFFIISEDDSFPGYIAALPVLGAVFILGLGGTPDRMVERFLSLSPMVLIGRMSYSLYLWHWPLFCLVDYKLYLASNVTRLVLKVGLSAVLTAGCYYWIEKPGREFFNRPKNRTLTFVFLACAVLLVVALGLAVRENTYITADLWQVPRGGVVYNPSGKNGSMVLMGDSNGSMYAVTFRALAFEKGLKLNIISVGGLDPLPPSGAQGSQLWITSLTYLKGEKPDYVVLISHWMATLSGGKERLGEAIRELKPYTGHIILVTQPPELPEQSTREAMRNGSRPPFSEDPDVHSLRTKANAWVESFEGNGVTVVNIEPYFSDKDGTVIMTDRDGHWLYDDRSHLSWFGTERVKAEIAKALVNTK